MHRLQKEDGAVLILDRKISSKVFHYGINEPVGKIVS